MNAIAIEAQRATTVGRGAKHESAVPERQSPKLHRPVDQGEVMMSEFTGGEIYKIEQPPTLCIIGVDGSVRWMKQANPASIAKAPVLLALWYATDGKDRP